MDLIAAEIRRPVDWKVAKLRHTRATYLHLRLKLSADKSALSTSSGSPVVAVPSGAGAK